MFIEGNSFELPVIHFSRFGSSRTDLRSRSFRSNPIEPHLVAEVADRPAARIDEMFLKAVFAEAGSGADVGVGLARIQRLQAGTAPPILRATLFGQTAVVPFAEPAASHERFRGCVYVAMEGGIL